MMRYDAPGIYDLDESTPSARSRRLLRPLRLAAVALALIFLPTLLRAQGITIYPPHIYPGLNFITINAPGGLAQVTGFVGGRWREMLTGLSSPHLKIIAGPTFAKCGKRVTLVVFLNTTRSVDFQIRVADCRNNIKYFDFEGSEFWNVYREDFGTVLQGSTACRTFRVDALGVGAVIDSVTSPSSLFKIRYTGTRPPVRINRTSSYRYDVCFTATKAGRVKMPIFVYLRRKYPAGGQTNFIVADTAYVNVVPQPARPAAKPKNTPRNPSRVLIAQPKPIIIAPPKPKDTLKPIPRVATVAIREMPSIPPPSRNTVIAARSDFADIIVEEEVTDPTTHRVIILPTARSVDSGKFFVSNYDLAGWLAGYGLDDRTTLLGGFLYIPSFINYNLVATAGGRYEFYREGVVRAAAGAQANYSQSETSSIILLSPYAVVSVGDDDQRISAALGYTWRRHSPKEEPSFNRTAVVASIGGDYRIGQHWKVAAETHVLQDANYQPLALALRYFNNRFAIDAGLGIDLGLAGEERAGVTIAPIVSATWVW